MNTLDNWSFLLDQLKEKEHLRSDAQLGESLGVTRGFICSIRKGRKAMPIDKAKMIFDRLDIKPDPVTFAYLLAERKMKKYLTEIQVQK